MVDLKIDKATAMIAVCKMYGISYTWIREAASAKILTPGHNITFDFEDDKHER